MRAEHLLMETEKKLFFLLISQHLSCPCPAAVEVLSGWLQINTRVLMCVKLHKESLLCSWTIFFQIVVVWIL